MKFQGTVLITILSILSLTLTYGQGNKLNCHKFKYGTFKIEGDGLEVRVDRYEEYQIEKTSFGESKYKVVWKSECEYDLELIETEIEFMKNSIGWIFQVKIIETKANKYIYECRVEGIDLVDTRICKRISKKM